MRHTFSLVCAGLLALTLLAGCEKTTAPKTVRAPLSVETLTVEAADQPRWITLLGQAEGGREVEVKSQVSGILKKVAFTEGAEVKAGDVLYQIDPAPFEARLKSATANTRSAKATLAEAKTSYERTRALFEKGAKSRQDLDEANRAPRRLLSLQRGDRLRKGRGHQPRMDDREGSRLRSRERHAVQ